MNNEEIKPEVIAVWRELHQYIENTRANFDPDEYIHKVFDNALDNQVIIDYWEDGFRERYSKGYRYWLITFFEEITEDVVEQLIADYHALYDKLDAIAKYDFEYEIPNELRDTYKTYVMPLDENNPYSDLENRCKNIPVHSLSEYDLIASAAWLCNSINDLSDKKTINEAQRMLINAMITTLEVDLITLKSID